jgi:glycogen operon protein
MLPDLARRIHGSSDIFEHSGRRPSASINYVTSHDGFTLADLVSYRERHNEKNGEGNRDGHQESYGDNYGVEGPTGDSTINVLRWRQQRNMLAPLLFSQGTPMLLGGDEFGRSQQGNNNAYCQDNALNWFDWESDSGRRSKQVDFISHLIALRNRFPIFALDNYIHFNEDPNEPVAEWFGKSGELMQPNHWSDHQSRTLGHLLSWQSEHTGLMDRLLLIVHAGRDATSFKLPELPDVDRWEILFDTALETGIPDPGNCVVRSQLRLFSCSTVMLLAHVRQQTLNFEETDTAGSDYE